MAGDVIIRKQRISIIASTEKLAFECRQYANESLTDNFRIMYEKLFHPGLSSDQHVMIDSLKVNLGELSTYDFKHHFFALLEEKISTELRRQFQNVASSKEFEDAGGNNPEPIYATENQQNREALFTFLESGIFPWWYQKKNGKTPAELINNFSVEERCKFLTSLIGRASSFTADTVKTIVKRLFIHLQPSSHETYLVELTRLFSEKSYSKNMQTLIHQKDYLSKLFRITLRDFYEYAVVFVLTTPYQSDFLREFLVYLKQFSPITPEEFQSRLKEKLFKDLNINVSVDLAKNFKISNADKKSLIPTTKVQTKLPDQDKGLYVANAGLIILHPFLPAFIKGLNLLNADNQFASREAQNKAAVLLYYLQYSKADYKEWEMPLNKILVGLATGDLIPDNIVLSDADKEETIALMQSVIENWTALKGASIEALQTTFLTREGKLTFKENYWLIQVERSGVDILLDRLPWGIDTIKLPWLKELISVEW